MKKRGESASTKLPLNRIKKIMQANKEIGKIQSNTPFVIAHALELFIEDITKLSSQLAQKNCDTKVNPSHIKTVINDHSGDPACLGVSLPETFFQNLMKQQKASSGKGSAGKA
jgi:histone H3/H4